MKELFTSKKLFAFIVGVLTAVIHVLSAKYLGIEIPIEITISVIGTGVIYILSEAGLDAKDMDRRAAEKDAETKAKQYDDTIEKLINAVLGDDEKKEEKEEGSE
jgi:hypothetical protein